MLNFPGYDSPEEPAASRFYQAAHEQRPALMEKIEHLLTLVKTAQQKAPDDVNTNRRISYADCWKNYSLIVVRAKRHINQPYLRSEPGELTPKSVGDLKNLYSIINLLGNELDNLISSTDAVYLENAEYGQLMRDIMGKVDEIRIPFSEFNHETFTYPLLPREAGFGDYEPK